MNIGERILIRLNQIGKTQADLAKALNTKQSTVNGWTQLGRSPTGDSIIEISEFLDVSTDWLLKGENEKENKDMENEKTIEQLKAELKEEEENLDYIVMRGLRNYFDSVKICDDFFKTLSLNTGITVNRLKSFYVDVKSYLDFGKFGNTNKLREGTFENDFGLTICIPRYDEFEKMMEEKNYVLTAAKEKASCIQLLEKLKKIDELKKRITAEPSDEELAESDV